MYGNRKHKCNRTKGKDNKKQYKKFYLNINQSWNFDWNERGV
jgi:hypothetical protein